MAQTRGSFGILALAALGSTAAATACWDIVNKTDWADGLICYVNCNVAVPVLDEGTACAAPMSVGSPTVISCNVGTVTVMADGRLVCLHDGKFSSVTTSSSIICTEHCSPGGPQ